MDYKRLAHVLLYPPVILICLLAPISAVFLILCMVFLGSESPISIASYVLSAYILTVICVRMPEIIRCTRTFVKENRLIKIWRSNPRLRVNTQLYTSLSCNILFAAFQLALGIYHKTFWYCSLGAYYICLVFMRSFLVLYTTRHVGGERIKTELIKYRICGIAFLILNQALGVIIFFMLYFERSFEHHMITAIAMAVYTFTAFTVASVNIIRFKKYKSPVYSASKAISLAAACVSMLTLTSTMLTTFSDGSITPKMQRFMLGAVGVAVIFVVLGMAIYMIVNGTKRLNLLKREEEKEQ